MRIRFWGTRGSIPKPGPTTLRHGGNTACVEVRAADGTLVVLDCGTGAYALGRALVAAGSAPVRGHLLIGHTHWDHIQGFPFFEPFFTPGHRWSVYAPGHSGRQLEDTLAGQMAYEYSPINLEALRAEVDFQDLTEGSLELGGIRVEAQYLNHPALTLGYRLEADGATLVYATDHEPHSLHPHGADASAEPVHHEDRRHARFLADADLVIHDAQYTLAEFPGRAGWGHTPVERAVDYAILARARRLALFHHDPERSDERVDAILEMARKRASEVGAALEIFAAAEGQELELTNPARRRTGHRSATPSALLGAERSRDSVLIVDDDPHLAALLEATLETEGVDVVSTQDGESALRFARELRPRLILLDMHLPGCDGLEVCRRLRADAAQALADVPILMLTGAKLEERDLIEAFRAGATDYLTKPIKTTLVRSRVRGWLLRTSARA